MIADSQPLEGTKFNKAGKKWFCGTVIKVGAVTILTIALLFPVIWMISTSFKPAGEVFAVPPTLIPKRPTLDSYWLILRQERYRQYFFNSYFISIIVTVISLTLASLAAYGFSRMPIKGKKFLLFGTLVLQMFPGVVLIIPYFNLAKVFNLFNTYTALVLADCSLILPFCIWMLKSYIDGISVELEEAAMIDGCSQLGALRHVLIPLSLPGLVATGTWAFLGAWNEYMFASILLTSPEKAPVTLGMAEFFGQFAMNWNAIMVVGTLSSIPLMLIFIFLQRYLIQGMTAGGVKG
jgi:multiple sugar transport system permease protein